MEMRMMKKGMDMCPSCMNGMHSDSDMEGGMKVCMDNTMLIKEHEKLIDVLRNGTAAMRAKEAAKQQAELMRLMSRPMVEPGMDRPAMMKHKEGDALIHMYR
jgi:hypothetical protein